VSGQLHAPAVLLPAKKPRYPLVGRLGVTHSRSERGGEEKKSLFYPFQESNPGRPPRSLVLVLTELTTAP
jgi:hypothetical protein